MSGYLFIDATDEVELITTLTGGLILESILDNEEDSESE